MPASAFGGEMQHIIQWTSVTSGPVGGVGARQWRAVYKVHSAGAVEIQSGGVFNCGEDSPQGVVVIVVSHRRETVGGI